MTADTASVRSRPGATQADRPPNDDVADSGPAHAAHGIALLAAGRSAEARAALRTAVALGDTGPVTLLNLALAEEQAGDRPRARSLMRRVAAAEPGWAEPLIRLAESLRAAGEAAAAERAYREALDREPRRCEALLGLAGLLITRGDALEARDLLLRCLGIDPDRAEAWDALGLALLRTREATLAESAFIEAQRLAPWVLDYVLHGIDGVTADGLKGIAWPEGSAGAEPADCASKTSDLAAAEAIRLEQLCLADPTNFVPRAALGVLRERMGQREAAIDALTIATALAPEERLPALFLSGILARSNRLREAEAALRRAAALDPDNPQIQNDLAAVLMRLHRHAEARGLLLDHINRHGEQIATLCNLANATVCLGMQAEAVANARRAIALYPDAALPRRTLCNTLAYQDGVGPGELLAALRACGDRLSRGTMPPLTNTPDPDRKLVVGLLSGTLKTHPVGWLTIAGFETLDPERFELVCLGRDASPGDTIARRFRAVARDWIDVDAMGDQALALAARERGIDILIDLGGYGDAARMTACAYRLAPVQIKWVGMQNHSSGLAEMDWIISDRWETPDALRPFYSERLLRLPDGYVCYSPPPYAPEVATLPALTHGFVTFGCFNNLAKITPAVITAWCAILTRLPDARLVLKTHQFSDGPTRERVRAAFVADGIAAERVELRGPSGHRAFMDEYNQIDIALDPFPYSGGLTTCEALWMGVPTVMLPGESFASRHSLSHMSNAGLFGWAAADVEEYVTIAVARASDPAGLATLRAGLRARVKASPLCDAPRFGRNLGQALRHAWTEWCAGR